MGSRKNNPRIQSLRVQNVLAIEHVELKPRTDGVTIVAGKNEQGKTSLLRAVEMLLEYRAATRKVGKPLRNGADKGWVEMELDDGLIVRREFADNGRTKLTVERGGMKSSSPQSFLDAIRPPDLLDPLAFSTMPPAERRRLMILISGMGDELAEAEEKIAEAEGSRRDLGRDAKRLQAACDEIPDPPEDTPERVVSVAELTAELDLLHEARAAHEALVRSAEDAEVGAHQAADEVRTLEMELERARGSLGRAREQAARAKAAVDAATEPPGDEAIRAKIASADEANEKVRLWIRKNDADEEAEVAAARHRAAEELVAAARAVRDELVQRAELPLAGLGFDDEDATYDGVRWVDIATSRQLQIGLALGQAQHPGLRVFVIHRGESLDMDTLAHVNAWAADNGVQIIMEVVGGEGHEGAFVLEAGKLKSAAAKGKASDESEVR